MKLAVVAEILRQAIALVKEPYHHLFIWNHCVYVMAKWRGTQNYFSMPSPLRRLRHLTISEYDVGKARLSTIAAFLSRSPLFPQLPSRKKADYRAVFSLKSSKFARVPRTNSDDDTDEDGDSDDGDD
jgi:hypothetical protein